MNIILFQRIATQLLKTAYGLNLNDTNLSDEAVVSTHISAGSRPYQAINDLAAQSELARVDQLSLFSHEKQDLTAQDEQLAMVACDGSVILGEEMTTCPKCGVRTEFDDLSKGLQHHKCLNGRCGNEFIGEPSQSARRLRKAQAAAAGKPGEAIDLKARAPLPASVRKRLQADALNVKATAARKGLTLNRYQEHDETSAAKYDFELGCWLYRFMQLRSRSMSASEYLQERVNLVIRIFESDITNPRYRFYSVFDFGERDFDGMFEEGDSWELIAELRKHLKHDQKGLIAKAFDAYKWPREEELQAT